MKTDWQECLRPDPDDEAVKFCISLNQRGEIAMAYSTWVAFAQPWFVVLLYDPGSRQIGIKPVRPGTKNAFPVWHVRGTNARVIRARRLIKQFHIEITQTLRFREPHFTNGVWALDLNSAFVPGKVSRHWKRKAADGRSLTVREG
jgi:hypothetical protein